MLQSSSLAKTVRQKGNAKKAAETKPADDQKTEVAIRSIRHWSSSDVTHVAIDLEGELQYKIGHLDDPERLFFDLYGAHLPEKVRGYKLNIPDGFVSNIRVGDGEGVPRVALDLNTPVEYSATLIPEPYRLEITLHRLSAKLSHGAAAPRSVAEPQPIIIGEVGKGAKHDGEDEHLVPVGDSSASQANDTPQENGNGGRSLVRALGLKIGRIVIDPGHGGDDTGGIGPTGLDEKDVVLDVATRLGRLLQGLGAEVTYTRATDIYLPLEARTGIANREQGDLFISIHGNTNPDRTARGVETYYLNFTSAPDALEVAARENTVAQKSVGQLRDLVQKIALQDKVQESRELAVAVQNSIGKDLPDVRNRGVKEAPFIVLTGADMPAILTEISFLSNPEDESNLKDPEYRQKIALALYQGIADYISKLGGVQLPVKTAAAAAGVSITPTPPSPPPAMIPPTRSDVILGYIAENRPFVVTAFLLMAAWSFFLLTPGTPGRPRKISYLQEPAVAGDKAPGQVTEIPESKHSYAQHRKLRLVRRS